MAKHVVLAVAGAGKTYYLCHKLNPDIRNLILAYTHENIHNIRKELIDAFGHVPDRTRISTFDAFVYNEIILPYESSIREFFNRSDFKSLGITTIDPPEQSLYINGKRFSNKQYIKQEYLEHYITKYNQYYCNRLSKLALRIQINKKPLIERIAERLNLFYDAILIDEFQDFREHDFDLIFNLSSKLNQITLVGDYYQHSVSAINNSGKPFKKGNSYISYDEFLKSLVEAGYLVDTDTLNVSRRCSPEVCWFVTEKLGIYIKSDGKHNGRVIFINDSIETVHNLLRDSSVLKLLYNNANKYSFKAMNWSYSKGDTFDKVCVILTEKFDNITDPDFKLNDISIIVLNRLYVALTRSKGDVYILPSFMFNQVKSLYSIHVDH